MKKNVLIMPLLTISSGHHHVADTIRRELSCEFKTEKVELLSYTFGKGEYAISKTYLGWIKKGPKFYSAIYKRLAHPDKEAVFSHVFYRKLFLKKTEEIIKRYRPDIIICTHALPSCLLDHLKSIGKIKVPVVNVYTDYFINNLWGQKSIDFHLVPDEDFKEELINSGVNPDRLMVTGIPTNHVISWSTRKEHTYKNQYQVLISGGNLGTGNLETFLNKIKATGRIHYKVLCGKNHRLLKHLQMKNNKFITGYPYINSKKEMNGLYEDSDAIISKPGGVTLAESLKKRLPIFIFDYLPGQEEFNLRFFQKHQLGKTISGKEDIESQLLDILDDQSAYEQLQNHIQQYHQRIEKVDYAELFELLMIDKPISTGAK